VLVEHLDLGAQWEELESEPALLVAGVSQVVARDIFESIGGADGREFRVPRTPFRLLKADFEAVPDVSHALGADLAGVQTMLGMHGSVALAEG